MASTGDPGSWLANASFDASGMAAHASSGSAAGGMDRAALLRAAADALPSSSDDEESSDADLASRGHGARSPPRSPRGAGALPSRGDDGTSRKRRHRSKERKQKEHKHKEHKSKERIKHKRARSDTEKIRELERRAAQAGLAPARGSGGLLLGSFGLGSASSRGAAAATAAAGGSSGDGVVYDLAGDAQNLVYGSLYAGGWR